MPLQPDSWSLKEEVLLLSLIHVSSPGGTCRTKWRTWYQTAACMNQRTPTLLPECSRRYTEASIARYYITHLRPRYTSTPHIPRHTLNGDGPARDNLLASMPASTPPIPAIHISHNSPLTSDSVSDYEYHSSSEDDFTEWSPPETALLRQHLDFLMPGGLCRDRPWRTLPEIARAMNDRARELKLCVRVYTTEGIWKHYNENVRGEFGDWFEGLERGEGGEADEAGKGGALRVEMEGRERVEMEERGSDVTDFRWPLGWRPGMDASSDSMEISDSP